MLVRNLGCLLLQYSQTVVQQNVAITGQRDGAALNCFYAQANDNLAEAMERPRSAAATRVNTLERTRKDKGQAGVPHTGTEEEHFLR